ncbi:MAG: four helix bundle protein [Bacteroidetes bacterium]|nr:four helix bundle protein [Bacteroidota bacterium]
MKIIRFEDLIAWQKAQDLAIHIYYNFGSIKDFSFKNQICSAAVSVSNNIAEGFDSNSKKEFNRFLGISRNSCNEVKSMIYLAFRLQYIDERKKILIIGYCEEVARIIVGLMKSLEL